MKKLLLLTGFTFCFLFSSFSQNLVPNAGFENVTSPSCFVYGPGTFTSVVNGWTESNDGSPDLITTTIATTCEMSALGSGSYWGTQTPHGGDNYAAVITYCNGCVSEYREYISVQLQTPLVVGTTYVAEMWVSYASRSAHAANNLGMYFSDVSVYVPDYLHLPYTPQVVFPQVNTDSVNWVLLTDTFTATTAAPYLIIGNFSDDANTTVVSNPNAQPAYVWAIYYIDDVRVETVTAVPPVADLTASDISICPGTCINFTNLSQNATSYEWVFQGGTPASDTNANPPTVCYETPGIYSVTLTAYNSVGTDTANYTGYITVNPSPTPPTFSQVGDTLFVQQGYAAYQWYFGSDTISGATNYFYIVPLSGNYNIVVTDSNGCSIGAGILNVISGVNELTAQSSGFSIFPNPAHDQFTIQSSQLAINSIEIFNVVGEKVYAGTLNNVSLSGVEGRTQTINLKLSKGIYFVRVSNDEKVFTQKLVIQ